MPTHQSLGGSSDEQLLQRMVASHPERFGEEWWAQGEAARLEELRLHAREAHAEALLGLGRSEEAVSEAEGHGASGSSGRNNSENQRPRWEADSQRRPY